MKHRVYPIADTEPRCRPSEYCDQQGQCMRFKAPLPAHNAKVINGMSSRISLMGILGACIEFLEIPQDAAVP